jgi:hypothetical protein
VSINLGQPGCEAAARLRPHPDFKLILEALHEHARKAAHAALDAEHAMQASACGYARASRDLVIALEAATLQVKQQTVKALTGLAKKE